MTHNPVKNDYEIKVHLSTKHTVKMHLFEKYKIHMKKQIDMALYIILRNPTK